MTKPQIILGHEANQGHHNSDPGMQDRINRSRIYEDLSTICVIPTRGKIDARIMDSWWGLMSPMNQPFTRLTIKGMEVGAAYEAAVEMILAHPTLSKWKYMLTLEEDNMPPPDGLLMLLESIKNFDAVGGLYWTKGEGGMPMIYGNPKEMPKMFNPQMPQTNSIQECNGLGMGFTLFRLEMFRKIDRPWFKTLQEFIPGQGTRAFTQDLYFFDHAAKHGFRFACDTRVRVGHYDDVTDRVW